MKKSKKEQRKEYTKQWRLKNKERTKEVSKEYYSKNKEERLKYFKKYYSKNKEYKKAQMREYYLKNIEKKKEYKLKNREHFKEYKREYENRRYKTDINFRVSKICRTRILQALKGLNKSASTMKLIGCTIDELRNHIESKFEPWMTWENQGRGGWDIEHIKACAKFNLVDPEQQCACFNWSNLQPMEHIANIKKGVRE